MSPPPDLLALAGLGLLLGFRHAFEPDHLAAVSTLATRQGRFLDARRLGLARGGGDNPSGGGGGGAGIPFRPELPPRLSPSAGFFFGPPVVWVGGVGLFRVARRRG